MTLPYAFLPQSNHRRHHPAGNHLVGNRDSAYHLSQVTDSGRSKKNGGDAGRMPAWAPARAPGCAPRIIAIVGPTASGKSGLGIELALRIDGEIINCDS